MARSKTTLLAAATLCVAMAAPALAKDKGAPGPLAGAGLPFLLAVGAAGAYKALRNKRRGGEQRQEAGQD